MDIGTPWRTSDKGPKANGEMMEGSRLYPGPGCTWKPAGGLKRSTKPLWSVMRSAIPKFQ